MSKPYHMNFLWYTLRPSYNFKYLKEKHQVYKIISINNVQSETLSTVNRHLNYFEKQNLSTKILWNESDAIYRQTDYFSQIQIFR